MRKTISVKWLEKNNACEDAIEEFKNQKERSTIKILKKLGVNNFNWFNWLVCHLLKTKKQRVKYAIYAAKLVIDIYEKEYSDDNRAREAITAAERYLKSPSVKNKDAAAYAAADAAYAARAAYAAADAAYAAQNEIRNKIIKYAYKLLKEKDK